MVLLVLDALDEVKGAKEEIQQYLERYYRINLAAFVYPLRSYCDFRERT